MSTVYVKIASTMISRWVLILFIDIYYIGLYNTEHMIGSPRPWGTRKDVYSTHRGGSKGIYSWRDVFIYLRCYGNCRIHYYLSFLYNMGKFNKILVYIVINLVLCRPIFMNIISYAERLYTSSCTENGRRRWRLYQLLRMKIIPLILYFVFLRIIARACCILQYLQHNS
jgi:hypothetical protein